MELDAGDLVFVMAAKGSRLLSPMTSKPGGSLRTWSPWLIQTSSCGGVPAKSERIDVHVDGGGTVFALVRADHPAAQLVRQELHAVANAQHRQICSQTQSGNAGAPSFVDAGRSAGEDDAGRIERLHLAPGRIEMHHFAVDPGLAHTAGDELAVLGAEIEHHHSFGMHGFHRSFDRSAGLVRQAVPSERSRKATWGNSSADRRIACAKWCICARAAPPVPARHVCGMHRPGLKPQGYRTEVPAGLCTSLLTSAGR